MLILLSYFLLLFIVQFTYDFSHSLNFFRLIDFITNNWDSIDWYLWLSPFSENRQFFRKIQVDAAAHGWINLIDFFLFIVNVFNHGNLVLGLPIVNHSVLVWAQNHLFFVDLFNLLVLMKLKEKLECWALAKDWFYIDSATKLFNYLLRNVQS